MAPKQFGAAAHPAAQTKPLKTTRSEAVSTAHTTRPPLPVLIKCFTMQRASCNEHLIACARWGHGRTCLSQINLCKLKIRSKGTAKVLFLDLRDGVVN